MRGGFFCALRISTCAPATYRRRNNAARYRLGLQYTHFTKYLGARSNYDGLGRNAGDNDTLFVYLWAAYW